MTITIVVVVLALVIGLLANRFLRSRITGEDAGYPDHSACAMHCVAVKSMLCQLLTPGWLCVMRLNPRTDATKKHISRSGH